MRPRRLLKDRAVRRIDLDAVRLVAARPLELGPEGTISAGTDVTETARAWPTLPRHLRRGTIVARPVVALVVDDDDEGDDEPERDTPGGSLDDPPPHEAEQPDETSAPAAASPPGEAVAAGDPGQSKGRRRKG